MIYVELTLNIAPADAVNAGARWKADDGDWQASGDYIIGEDGGHTMEFTYLPCWQKPDDIDITLALDSGEIETLNVSYLEISSCVPADLNGDSQLDLQDAVIALQVLAGFDVSDKISSDYPASGADIDGDGKVGMAEAIYALEKTAELR